jgi:hypothetical protein
MYEIIIRVETDADRELECDCHSCNYSQNIRIHDDPIVCSKCKKEIEFTPYDTTTFEAIDKELCLSCLTERKERHAKLSKRMTQLKKRQQKLITEITQAEYELFTLNN